MCFKFPRWGKEQEKRSSLIYTRRNTLPYFSIFLMDVNCLMILLYDITVLVTM